MGNPIQSYFETGRELGHKVDADVSEAQRRRDVVKALGEGQATRYLTRTFEKPQQEILEGYEKPATEQVDKYAEEAGLSDEQKQRMITDVKTDRLVLEAAMNEQTWNKAMQSLGYSVKQTSQLLNYFKQKQQAQREAYAKLIKTGVTLFASVIAAPFTGGASMALGGAAIAKGIGDARTSESQSFDTGGSENLTDISGDMG